MTRIVSRKPLPALIAAVLPATAALLSGFLFSGCGDTTSSGPEILLVDGVSVYLSEFEKELEYQLISARIAAEGAERTPGQVTTEELKAKIVNEMLIPLAVIKGHFKEHLPDLLKKMEDIRGAVKEDRSNFSTLSAEKSTPSTAKSGGRLGQLTRQSGQPYPIMQKTFSTDPGTISKPFVSLVGYHIVHAKQFIKGFSPAQDRMEAEQILLAWDGNEAFLQEILPGLVAGAKVEVVDPAFGPFVKKRAP